jgi:hypothetical protein
MNSNNFVPELETETSHDYHQGSHICTRVAGVTFNGRQSIVAQLSIGEQILLIREPTNYYDHNAIRVERKKGQQIGYLNRFLAANLVRFFDTHNEPVSANVQCLTGSRQNGYSLGVVITFNVP